MRAFPKQIKFFDSEHAEGAIGLSNSRGDFHHIAELSPKVYLCMETKICGVPEGNQGFRT